MPTISVRIPQMGEGLQEARLVGFLKQPGDAIKRDDPLYQMETDKAVMDVESPYDGVLVEWTAEEGAVLPIGAEIARMEVAEGVKEMAVGHEPPLKREEAAPALEPVAAQAPSRTAQVPPRTRRYLKEKGLLEIVGRIPAKGGKLMPEDVDAYLATREAAGVTADGAAAVTPAEDYEEFELSQRQRTLSYRLARGSQLCVPGTIMVETDWGAIEAVRERVKAERGDFQPSSFTMIAWCVAQAARHHPKFRSTLPSETTLRTYKTLSLGIAVALPDDELVTAVVQGADQLSWREFAEKARAQIELARNGEDQASAATTLSITNMAAFGLRNAVPVVVSPAVATLFIGEAFSLPVPKEDGYEFLRKVMLSLTFDHRVINGVGAANFLNEVKEGIESFELPQQ